MANEGSRGTTEPNGNERVRERERVVWGMQGIHGFYRLAAYCILARRPFGTHQKLPLWSVAIKMEDGTANIRNCRQEPGHLHELRLGNGAGRLLIKQSGRGGGSDGRGGELQVRLLLI